MIELLRKYNVLLFISFLLILPLSSFAQFESPVKWSVTTQQIAGDTFQVRLKATIADKHHIYKAYKNKGTQKHTYKYMHIHAKIRSKCTLGARSTVYRTGCVL